MASFSRLQLAAALLEYDNDPSDPNAPYRSAHESAIFAHLRRFPRASGAPRKSHDYLGVALPSETGSLGGRESAVGDRRSRTSRGSVDILRNPFGEEISEEDSAVVEEPEEMEVDLASWGLDTFMPKEKGSKSSRNKSKMAAIPDSHPVSSLRFPQDSTVDPARDRIAGKRAMSMGTMDRPLMERSSVDRTSLYLGDNRRYSVGSLLDSTNNGAPRPPVHRRHTSSHALVENLNSVPSLGSVPFPARSESPPLDDPLRSFSQPSLLDTQLRDLTYSSLSLGSGLILGETQQNPILQFDAKHARTVSGGTIGTPMNDNPFSLEPPSRASKFDPKAAAHARTTSNVSIGPREIPDDDKGSVITGRSRARPYSTLELLRPKVLIMPSPLQPAEQTPTAEPVKPRDGFQFTTSGPPLPPGARSNRRSSAYLLGNDAPASLEGPSAQNYLTPNSYTGLSLSQLTFRNTLIVGGQRDGDTNNAMPRAAEDGEQILKEESDEDEPLADKKLTEDRRRPAGKLFGKSLIDDLEDRKSHMRSRQRVFVGDDRPSMMARRHSQRTNTLIDPASLQSPAAAAQSANPLLTRSNSAIKPLLNFDNERMPKLSPDTRMPKMRSVFGVDTLWEREMVKLKEIEVQEQREAEERRQREEAAERAKERKKKRKGKEKSDVMEDLQDLPSPVVASDAEPRVSEEPPVLPTIRKAVARLPPLPADDDSNSESSASQDVPHDRSSKDTGAENWHSGSSDDADVGPRRTTGVGPRYLKPVRRPGQIAATHDDSDEDIPLAATLRRTAHQGARFQPPEDDSDEEKPLSTLIEKTKLGIPSINFDAPAVPGRKRNGVDDDDDDDDKPLGLRVPLSSLGHNSIGTEEDDDDDRPLGFHPEQQRRTQYNIMVQQHQEQMMMQAQMHQSMFFPQAPVLGSGYFGPPMPPPMMMGPFPGSMMPFPSDNEAKFGRVDRWRHDVAVEGQR